MAFWRQGAVTSRLREYFRYHGIFAPLVRVMRDVDFRYKALLVAAAFAIPTGIVVSVQLQVQWAEWRKATLQQDGWQYVKHVDHLVTAVIPRRSALANMPSDQAYTPNNKLEHDIESSYLALANTHDLIGAQFGIATEWQAVNSAYQHLNDSASAGPARAALHNQFIGLAQALSHAVADGARLTLNADHRVQMMSELSIELLPAMDEAISRLYSHLSQLIKEPQRSAASAEQTLLDAGRLRDTAAQLRQHLERIQHIEGTQCMRGNEPLFANAERFAQDMRAFALDTQAPLDLAGGFLGDQTLHNDLRQIRNTCLSELDAALSANQARVGRHLGWLIGMVILGIALATYVMMAFSRVMRGGMQLIQFEVARMAKGDLSGRVLPRGDDEVAHTLRSLRVSLAKLADLFTVVRRGVASVSHASGDISSASEALASRIQEATDAMAGLQQGIIATLDYLEANQQCVSEAVDRARDVTADAGRSRRAMTHLAEVIEGLQHRSREIGKIVSLIDGIAFQTNLLALNASVGAAKAGASGKGFAVVASEVRSLALRVAEAAGQINKVVGDATVETAQGQELARSTVEAVLSTESNVNEMGRILNRLAQVTLTGRDNAEHMTTTLTAVNDNSERTSELVVQVARAARELRLQSLKLAEQSSKFKLG